MNSKMRLLFENLNEYWGKADRVELQGEHTGCGIIQQGILEEISMMSEVDAVKLINELSDSQINQIIVIVEEIIDAHPQTVHSFRMINNERNIYWLNDELRLLGFVDKV